MKLAGGRQPEVSTPYAAITTTPSQRANAAMKASYSAGLRLPNTVPSEMYSTRRPTMRSMGKSVVSWRSCTGGPTKR